ncbi:glycogen debranching protein GlgX [Rhizomicrobium electricum]|uniref:Glycogen debranching protein GlgX n=1 Tax=Rhizomicrobium electricum TaxID=480070 RepID=A0ABN1ETR9_9PROT|nr:glycogen operon protein [Rhizomicrobium electricum]
MTTGLRLSQGRPFPLGATFDGEGVNFALFSANATRIELCLFDDQEREYGRVDLPEKSEDVWFGYLKGAKPGQLYGYRVHGPYEPLAGHRFNPNKLLIDPYAKELTRPIAYDQRHCGFDPTDQRFDLSFDTRDSAPAVPKCRVLAEDFDWTGDPLLRTPRSHSVLYELNLRGYTMRHPGIDAGMRGSAAALASPEVIRYLKELGITAVELLPIHPFTTTSVQDKYGLREFWGYNSVNFFAVEPRYLASGGRAEFQRMVRVFHDAGIEVILDVVFNHSGEGNELGPTLSFRGIDNASYYWLADNKSRYRDLTGTGNTLNLAHPRVLQMVMDSLRYFVEHCHVDGFRFDLAVSLARDKGEFDPQSAFFACVLQDPVLVKTKMIAEPWDLGPGGYRLGGFPSRWSEWNDRFRNDVRRFWRGDARIGDLAVRLAGSSDVFCPPRRRPTAGVNFVTAHDGFTLEDLVSYNFKHNAANRENNRDGTDENFSWNCGVEGPTTNLNIQARRERQKRNLLATLLLSQGIPMLLAGDEFGRTQGGNNNAYCQDNETSWVDWQKLEENRDLVAFVRRLIWLRRDHPVFRRSFFFLGDPIDDSGIKDIVWLSPDGREMADADWHRPHAKVLGVRFAATGEMDVTSYTRRLDPHSFLLLVNAGEEPVNFVLPKVPVDKRWHWILDTAASDGEASGRFAAGTTFQLQAHALALFEGDV